MYWILLCVVLCGCDSEKIDCTATKISGVNSGKVKRVLESYNNQNSENKFEVEYEILSLPLLIDESGNNKFQRLLISITLKNEKESLSDVFNYQHLGFDDWKYDDAIYSAIAQKILIMELRMKNMTRNLK